MVTPLRADAIQPGDLVLMQRYAGPLVFGTVGEVNAINERYIEVQTDVACQVYHPFDLVPVVRPA